MIGLLVELIPIETTKWLSLAYHFPQLASQHDIHCVASVETSHARKAASLFILRQRGLRYLLYSLFLVTVLTIGAFSITFGLAKGLSEAFPNILGRATGYVFLAVVALVIVLWVFRFFSHKPKNIPTKNSEDDDLDFQEIDKIFSEESPVGFRDLVRRHRLLIIGVLFFLIMLIPCPYRPGGKIQILPPDQTQIQAPISGQITDVYFVGGDTCLFPKARWLAK
jgi:hypothetical protein